MKQRFSNNITTNRPTLGDKDGNVFSKLIFVFPVQGSANCLAVGHPLPIPKFLDEVVIENERPYPLKGVACIPDTQDRVVLISQLDQSPWDPVALRPVRPLMRYHERPFFTKGFTKGIPESFS
jgi:hypothetical protein